MAETHGCSDFWVSLWDNKAEGRNASGPVSRKPYVVKEIFLKLLTIKSLGLKGAIARTILFIVYRFIVWDRNPLYERLSWVWTLKETFYSCQSTLAFNLIRDLKYNSSCFKLFISCYLPCEKKCHLPIQIYVINTLQTFFAHIPFTSYTPVCKWCDALSS